ncbi:MAG: alpha/beta hydrolase [Bordetella sp.]|jgi:pimeloyl-ACP methyl ester carboxylesterase
MSDLSRLWTERLPRLLAAGADFYDIQTIRQSIDSIDQWPDAWENLAMAHHKRAQEHVRVSEWVSAGEAYSRACLYLHFGQFVYFKNLTRKHRLQRLQNEVYDKALPYLAVEAERLKISMGKSFIGAILKIPACASSPPCVILIPGADSTKEEFQNLEAVFHRRGLSTCSIDGPGQGLTWFDEKLCYDYERPVGYVIDTLSLRSDIDTDRIGLWGRSYGAYACLRAASDRRVSAAVSIGGFYDLSRVWPNMPESTKESLTYAMGVESTSKFLDSMLPHYTLAGHLSNIRCPVLIVHSGKDEVCPIEDSHRMMADLKNPSSRLELFEEGNHVCDNISHIVRPLMADWLRHSLNRD